MADSKRQEVLAAFQLCGELYNSGDFHGLAEYFTEDIVLFPPDCDPVIGKKDSSMMFAEYHSVGGQHLTHLEKGQMFEMLAEDTVDIIVFVDIRNQAGEIFSYMKDWVLFKKINGEWLIHRFAYSPRTKPTNCKANPEM